MNRIIAIAFVALVSVSISSGACADGRRLALLVGVSDYLNSIEIDPLKGPANDVSLLSEALEDRGFDPALVRRLSDDPSADGSPVLSNILDGFDWLQDEAEPGDTVVVFLAGHGTTQPNDDPATDPEPDGQDEVFLPKDAGSRDEVFRVKRGLVDDEISDRLAAIRAKGAFIVFITDSCRSETQDRAGIEVERPLLELSGRRFRYISPYDTLSEADYLQYIEAVDQASQAARGGTLTESRDVWSDGNAERSGYVSLFASQAHEATPEQILPRRNGIDVFGLFTFHLAAALMTHRELTWGQLLEVVRQDYRNLNLEVPTPVGDGALDTLVFGTGTRGRIVQWPVQRVNGDAVVQAGRVHSLREGAILSLYADPVSWAQEKFVGHAMIKTLGLTQSILEPTTPPDAEPWEIPQNVFARTDQSSFSYALTVAVPAPSSEETLFDQILASLRTIAPDSIDIDFVNAGEPADVSLHLTGERLWFIPPSGELVRSGAAETPSIDISWGREHDRELHVLELKVAIEAMLRRIGKSVGLARLVKTLEGASLTDTIEIEVVVERGDNASASAQSGPIETQNPIPLFNQDTIAITVTNTGTTAIDLTIIHADSVFDTTCLFPRASRQELNRIPPGKSWPIYPMKVNADRLGPESLTFLATEAIPLDRPNLCLLAGETRRGQVNVGLALTGRRRTLTGAEPQALAGARSIAIEIMDARIARNPPVQ